MKLKSLTIKNFQSFGPVPQRIELVDMTFLLGPNGAGKTATLQAVARLFAIDPALRGVRPSDFHVPSGSVTPEGELWIDAEFVFPEAGDEHVSTAPAIPEFLNQMQLESVDGPMTVRIRLTAKLDAGSEVTEQLDFIRSFDDEGEPAQMSPVDSIARRRIQLHYLPARRHPREQISYASTSMLGNALRAADWMAETQAIKEWNAKISDELAQNAAISELTSRLSEAWGSLHGGPALSSPSIGFGASDLDFLLRQLTVNFAPSPQGGSVNFEMLSDGQQSLLYISTVVALHRIGLDVVSAHSTSFDADKLRPAVFTIFAVEEPENSLSPFYLGRILRLLRESASEASCQALLATHSPAVMKRVNPRHVRFLRSSEDHSTHVSTIRLPDDQNEASKFIQQAVEAYPELYFARLVVLGEGASEQVVLPRLFSAHGAGVDEHSLAVVPLGGRHVNHMWQLLNDLRIPHLTLLDLDTCRFGGGWGRVRTALRNLKRYSIDPRMQADLSSVDPEDLRKWDEPGPAEDDASLECLESAGVFFSMPLDLDFMLLECFPQAYPPDAAAVIGDTTQAQATGVEEPTVVLLQQVLGKKGRDPVNDYTPEQLQLFRRYHTLFQMGSKPAAHLVALANLDDNALAAGVPLVLKRLVDRATSLLSPGPTEITP